MAKQYHEIDLYRQVAHYLNIKHPKVLYHFDLSGVHNPSRTTRGIYKSLNGRAWPDLFIAKPAFMSNTVNTASGLFLELKAEGTRLTKRDRGWASEHIAEQADVLAQLESQGYLAEFAVGLDDAIEHIERYLAGMA